MSTTTTACEKCGEPVSRDRAENLGSFARFLADMPTYCDGCINILDAHDLERKRRQDRLDRQADIDDRIRRSGLPNSRCVTIASLSHPADVLDAARDWTQDGGGLLLTGEVGVGKTTIAGAACFDRLQTRMVTWTSAPLLFARLGTGLGTEQHDWAVSLLSSRHGLVLDDIDKARPTAYGAEQIFLAVDQRIEHRAPLLVTSNLDPAELAARWPEPYGEPIASRLVGYCRVVVVGGADRRLEEQS